MPGIGNEKIESIQRKTTAIFFIIDSSGSMALDGRIGAVNSAIEETLQELVKMNKSNTDCKVEVAILEFATGANWHTPDGTKDPENIYWNYLTADGLTYMGEAFKMLEEKLHRTSGFMQNVSGSYAPVIFLMTDGEPNDDYRTPLEKLKANRWFNESIKIALAIGEEENDPILVEFTGKPKEESVVRVAGHERAADKLKKMITFLALKSTGFASDMLAAGGGSQNKQDQMGDVIKDINKNTDWDSDDFDIASPDKNDDGNW